MEMLSPVFCRAVPKAFSITSRMPESNVQRSLPFNDQVKRLPGMRIGELPSNDHARILDHMLA